MNGTLEAPRSFKRLVLLGSLVTVAIEVGLFVLLWRLGTLMDPGPDPLASAAFIALGSVVTLQAMGIVGVVWVLVAMSRTTLRYDEVGLALEHPWRDWHGDWSAVRHSWHHGPWLVLELGGQWRRWYVWTGWHGGAALAPVRARLPAGAWLEGSAKHGHLLRTVLPIVLATAGLGGLAFVGVLRWLDRLE